MAIEQTTRAYGGVSASARIEQRRVTLLDAALTLADQDGWRQLTVEQVCKEAGLNKRYFYESFPDLDALAQEVVDHHARGWQAAAVSALDPKLSRPDLARAVLTAVVDYMTDDPRRVRVLFGELQAGSSMEAHRSGAVRAIIHVVIEKARDIHRDVRADDPVAQIAATVLLSGTGQVVQDWIAGRLPVTKALLIDDLAALWVITGDGAVALARGRNAKDI